MKATIIVLVGLAIVLVSIRLMRAHAQKSSGPRKISPEIYQGLRNQALRMSRAKLGLPATPTPAAPWGVIMDWGVGRGTATVVAFSDGHASIYLSNGGFLGGAESHESIRHAAKQMVAVAPECQPQARSMT